MPFPHHKLTSDKFLGGRVTAWQPKDGYRAATDPVLLAAAVDARTGQSVLELGCGVGVAILCLGARIPDLSLVGVERQADYADLAVRNAGENGADFEGITADISSLPDALRIRSFDHVFFNPPYYPAGGGTPARNPGREQALREETPLSVWTDVACRRLTPKGWLTTITLAERLPELLAALPPSMGSIAIKPLTSRLGRPAGRILLRTRKAGRAATQLLAPLVLHQGKSHLKDGDDYTDEAQAIFRQGQALNWV
jgi:tRNA1Val (adenine37-N6)-methyltransferase